MRLRSHARLARAALLASFALALSAPGAVAATTQTALTASPPLPVWGQAVTLTATVTSTSTPTGSVDFSVDGTTVAGPVALDGQGKASFTTSSLEVGSRAVVASFTSTAGFDPSHGDLTVTVAKADVDVAETVSPDPTVAGQNATFTAQVTAHSPGSGIPTGAVQFSDDDGSPIGGPVALSGGVASIRAWAGAGSYRVHAEYFGDPHFNGNETTVDQTVNKADTTTTLTSSVAQVRPGQPVEVTAIVSVTPPGDVPTFGSLQFTVNGIPAAEPFPLDGAIGVRITRPAPQEPGEYVIGVAYSGDDNTNPSSASLTISVGSPAGGSGGGPAPGSGGGSAVDKKSLTAVGSTLMQALRKRGLAALSRTSERFTAPMAGVLEQHVDSPKPLKAAKAVRLAAGRLAFSGPGSGVLKLRLTAAGRRAIRKGKTVRLAIVTTFTPATGNPVSVVQRLTVKAKKGAKVSVADPGWTVDAVRRTPRRPSVGRVHGRL
jgi:hypothetical protein